MYELLLYSALPFSGYIYHQLARKLAATGPVLQGTLTERVLTRNTSNPKKEEKRYGPYYQWTYKEAGKTVTVHLTARQAKLFRRAIENNKRLEATLTEMRTLSRQLCEGGAEGVKKRTRRDPSPEP